MSERSVSKQKRGKRWYTIFAPEEYDRAELGQTVADEPEKIIGRTIETTLGELTDDAGANNTKLTFKITDVGPVAFTTKKADRSQEQAIRRVMIDLIEETAAERDFDSFVESAVEGRLSSAIYGEAKTIYPLRRVEIQKLTLEARPEEVAAEEEAAVDVEEEDVAVED
ncbi:MAG: 30S ribosomal protein S3ae [Haloplanus sp.]